MLPIDLDVVRVFVHVLAAAVWVGGQVVLAGVVPGLRRLGKEATSAAARGFGRVAWPAYVVLLLTGGWNAAVVDAGREGYSATLGVKLAVVLASGVAALVHQEARSPRARGVSGAVSGGTAVAALLLGVLLSES